MKIDMPTDSFTRPSLSAEEILTNAPWLRRLARSLLGTDRAAEFIALARRGGLR
jgi:hypothetical protein